MLDPFHTKQNFVCFANKSVYRKSFLVQRIFSRPKFSRLSPKFKDAIERIWRPTMFCQATISFFSLTAILCQVILFCRHDLRRKTLHVSDASKVANRVLLQLLVFSDVAWPRVLLTHLPLEILPKKCVLNLVKPFSGHFRAIKSQNLL